MSAKHITVSGTITEVEPLNGTDFTLEELKGYIGGGFIQVIYPESKNGAVMVLDEEGKLKNFPVNHVATKVWASMALPGDCIVGDVLLCHPEQLK